MLALQAMTGRASLVTRLVRLLRATRFRSLLRSVRCRAADVRVVLEDIVRLDSNDSVPGMPSRHARTILFTDDFWNVRHICTSATAMVE